MRSQQLASAASALRPAASSQEMEAAHATARSEMQRRSQAEAALRTAQEEKQRLQSELVAARQQMQQQQQQQQVVAPSNDVELASLRSQVERSASEIRSARSELSAARQEATEQRTAAEAANADLRAARGQAEQVQAMMSARQAEWDGAKARAVTQLKQLQSEKMALAQEAEAAKSQAAAAKAELSAWSGDAKAAAAERDALRSATASEAAARATDVERLGAEKARAEAALASAARAKEAAEAEAREARSAASSSEGRAKAAMEAAGEVQAACSSLKADVERLNQQLGTTKAELVDERAARAAASQEIEMLRRTEASVQAARETGGAEAELEVLRQRCSTLEGEVATLEARCQAEGEKGKAELAAAEERLTVASSAASAEKAAAERTQQALQQQLDASAAELSSANALRLEQADRIATAEAAAAKADARAMAAEAALHADSTASGSLVAEAEGRAAEQCRELQRLLTASEEMTAAKAEEVATVRDQLVGMHEEKERLDARIDLLERARNDAEAAAKAAAGTGGTLEAELHSALQARQAAEAERDQLKTEQLMLISDAEKSTAALAAAEQEAATYRRSADSLQTQLDQSLQKQLTLQEKVEQSASSKPNGSPSKDKPSSLQPLEDDDELAKELADEIAALKVSHSKQLKQMQAELRKALSGQGSGGGGGGNEAALQVMHEKEVDSLLAEIRTLRNALEHAHAEPLDTSKPPKLGGSDGSKQASQDDAPTIAWEVAVLGSLGELRHSLLGVCLMMNDEIDALKWSDGLRMTARSDMGAGSRANLARLASDDATDASEELNRLQLTVEALQSLSERLATSLHQGQARPPKWLLLGWHYLSKPCMPTRVTVRTEGFGAGVLSPLPPARPAGGAVAQMSAQVRAAIQQRRGYSAIHTYS